MSIDKAIKCLREGGVIAYPTEGVYGLGCDPTSLAGLEKILWLKRRSIEKGFILIAANFSQLDSYLEKVDPKTEQRILGSWPGPITWVLPAKKSVSHYVRGRHNTVAVRVTRHPIAKAICESFGGAIISTSANREHQSPAISAKEVDATFGATVDYICPGSVDNPGQPTPIRDGITNEVIRE